MPEDPVPNPSLIQSEWWRVTLESIGDGVIATDSAARVTFLNAVAEQLTGWTEQEAVGRPLDEIFRIVNEENQQPVESPVVRALRDGLVVGLANHTLLIDRNGLMRPIDDSAAPIRNDRGEVNGVVLIFRDVAARREAERALKQSEERFRLLVDGVADYAIFMLDPAGVIRSWNPGAERIKGYSAAEIIGKHFSIFYTQDAIDARWPTRELEIALRDGRLEDEGWRLRKDGSRFWANVVITALHDEAGNHKGFAKITRDLTQRRQLERARAQAEALADLDRRKDEFLAMLSHELRNPLAPIRNAVQLLQQYREPDQEKKQVLEIIDRQVAHLTRLVDDLLEVSRVASAKIRLQQRNVDAREVIQRAVESIRPVVAERGLALTVEVPDRPLPLHADATRLEQVLLNVLTNAAKYTEPGGRIRLAARRDDAMVVLNVSDTGIGIAPELLPRIFDLFTQAERSLDRSQGGLGVGLTIVRRVVEMHGGTVEARSAGLGRGSEFVIRLPLAPEAEPVPAKAASDAGAPGTAGATGRLRVLVVDDNVDAADSTGMLLKLMGHDVRVGYSAAAALQIAAEFKPHVSFLDIGLPEMDGFELARRLRSQPSLHDSRLIAVTGYGQPRDRERSRDAGFDAHLVKPVEPQQLLAALSGGKASG